jgi:hypothetical protein
LFIHRRIWPDGPGIVSSTSLPGVLDRHSRYWQLLAGVKLLCKFTKQSQQQRKPSRIQVTEQQPFGEAISKIRSFAQQTTKGIFSLSPYRSHVKRDEHVFVYVFRLNVSDHNPFLQPMK